MFRDFVATAGAAFAVVLLSGSVPAAHQADHPDGGAQPLRIVVPTVESRRVLTDGTFSAGEWDGAFEHRVSDKCSVYLLADSANLYVAFRFLGDVEADFVSEVYIASGDGTFLNLHSSGALGEGLNRLSPETRRATFEVGNAMGWESNVTGVSVRARGKEFRISRRKIPGDVMRMAGGMMIVNRTLRENISFPEGFDFASTDGWAELVLQSGGDAARGTRPSGSP